MKYRLRSAELEIKFHSRGSQFELYRHTLLRCLLIAIPFFNSVSVYFSENSLLDYWCYLISYYHSSEQIRIKILIGCFHWIFILLYIHEYLVNRTHYTNRKYKIFRLIILPNIFCWKNNIPVIIITINITLLLLMDLANVFS